MLTRRPGGVPVAATCVYGGPVRHAVLAHKERGRLALARPLGDALSAAVSVWLDPPARGGAATNLQAALVPAPSSPGAVRRRGQDPLLRIARRACVTLRRAGFDCTLVPALRHRRRVSDQSGLGLVARQANLRGSMTIRMGAEALLAGRRVIIVDDVVTTGATIGELARVLRATGRVPTGAAVIAAAL